MVLYFYQHFHVVQIVWLMNWLLENLRSIPCINIILDDSTSTLGLYTRLESFVDIIKVRHNNG